MLVHNHLQMHYNTIAHWQAFLFLVGVNCFLVEEFLCAECILLCFAHFLNQCQIQYLDCLVGKCEIVLLAEEFLCRECILLCFAYFLNLWQIQYLDCLVCKCELFFWQRNSFIESGFCSTFLIFLTNSKSNILTV